MAIRVLVAEGELLIIQTIASALGAAGCEVIGVARLLATPVPGQKLRFLKPNTDYTGTEQGELDLSDQPIDVAFLDYNIGTPNADTLIPVLGKANAFCIGLSDHPEGQAALFRAEPGVHIALTRKTDLGSLLLGKLGAGSLVWRDDYDVGRDGVVVLDLLYKQFGARR